MRVIAASIALSGTQLRAYSMQQTVISNKEKKKKNTAKYL